MENFFKATWVVAEYTGATLGRDHAACPENQAGECYGD